LGQREAVHHFERAKAGTAYDHKGGTALGWRPEFPPECRADPVEQGYGAPGACSLGKMTGIAGIPACSCAVALLPPGRSGTTGSPMINSSFRADAIVPRSVMIPPPAHTIAVPLVAPVTRGLSLNFLSSGSSCRVASGPQLLTTLRAGIGLPSNHS
jgi:hypothetical protein